MDVLVTGSNEGKVEIGTGWNGGKSWWSMADGRVLKPGNATAG